MGSDGPFPIAKDLESISRVAVNSYSGEVGVLGNRDGVVSVIRRPAVVQIHICTYQSEVFSPNSGTYGIYDTLAAKIQKIHDSNELEL
jgi:hypothetical protein